MMGKLQASELRAMASYIGTLPDDEVAKLAHVYEFKVQQWRMDFHIPSPKSATPTQDIEYSYPGILDMFLDYSDETIAETYKIFFELVVILRRITRIRRLDGRTAYTLLSKLCIDSPYLVEAVGRAIDEDVAEKFKVSRSWVCGIRRTMGIPAFGQSKLIVRQKKDVVSSKSVRMAEAKVTLADLRGVILENKVEVQTSPQKNYSEKHDDITPFTDDELRYMLWKRSESPHLTTHALSRIISEELGFDLWRVRRVLRGETYKNKIKELQRENH